MKKITIALSLLLSGFIFAQDGVLDQSFGTNGYVLLNTNNPVSIANFVQPDGKILYNKGSKFYRLNANGTTDTSFGVAGELNIIQPYQYIEGFAVSGGQIVLVTKAIDDIYTMGRYNFDGSVDNSLGTGLGYVNLSRGSINGHVAITMSSDNKLLMGGNSDSAFGTYNDYFVRKYNTDGNVDNTFNYNASGIGINIGTTPWGASNEYIKNVKVSPAGSVIVSGYSRFQTSSGSGHYSASFAIIPETGNPITSSVYQSQFPPKSEITFDQNSNIYMLGGQQANLFYLEPVNVIQKYNASGAIDNSFGNSGVLTVSLMVNATTKADFRKILIQPDGKLVLAGIAANINAAEYPYLIIARYFQDGALDTTFGNNGYFLHDIAHPTSDANKNTITGLFSSADYSNIYVTGSNLENAIVLKFANNSLDTQEFSMPEFKVFPNPAKGIVTVRSSTNIDSVSVINLLGQQLANIPINSDEGKVDLSAMTAGTYILKLNSGTKTKMIKVIKE